MADRLPGSRFPERADSNFCDKCGRDITEHLHPRRAHVRQPLGPMRYVCICGTKYLTGATEWDDLSHWEKRRWLFDGVFAFLLCVPLLISAGLGYAAWHRHSVILLFICAVFLMPPLFFLKLIGILLLVFVDIARSIWRTRFGSA